MGMGQGIRTGLVQGGITCVVQTQFSSFYFHNLERQNARLIDVKDGLH